jgi:S1-C subfamily serine protease
LGDTVVVGAGRAAHETTGDARGAFTFTAPAGALRVTCRTGAFSHTEGSASVTVARGQTTAVEIAMARNGPKADTGFTLDVWSVSPRIFEVIAGGPAAAAGLRPGDVITAVDGVAVGGFDRSVAAMLIAGHPAGTSVEITTARGVVRLTLR